MEKKYEELEFIKDLPLIEVNGIKVRVFGGGVALPLDYASKFDGVCMIDPIITHEDGRLGYLLNADYLLLRDEKPETYNKVDKLYQVIRYAESKYATVNEKE